MTKPRNRKPGMNHTVSLTDGEREQIGAWAAERGKRAGPWFCECALTVDPFPEMPPARPLVLDAGEQRGLSRVPLRRPPAICAPAVKRRRISLTTCAPCWRCALRRWIATAGVSKRSHCFVGCSAKSVLQWSRQRFCRRPTKCRKHRTGRQGQGPMKVPAGQLNRNPICSKGAQAARPAALDVVIADGQKRCVRQGPM